MIISHEDIKGNTVSGSPDIGASEGCGYKRLTIFLFESLTSVLVN